MRLAEEMGAHILNHDSTKSRTNSQESAVVLEAGETEGGQEGRDGTPGEHVRNALGIVVV